MNVDALDDINIDGDVIPELDVDTNMISLYLNGYSVN